MKRATPTTSQTTPVVTQEVTPSIAKSNATKTIVPPSATEVTPQKIYVASTQVAPTSYNAPQTVPAHRSARQVLARQKSAAKETPAQRHRQEVADRKLRAKLK